MRRLVAAVVVAVLASGCSATLSAIYWRTMPARFRFYRKCMERRAEARAAREAEEAAEQ